MSYMVNDHLDAQLFSIYLFQFSTCFEQPRAHHQENQMYQYNLWYMSLCVGDQFVCRSDLHTNWSPTQSDIYQRLYWYNWFSWWWARGCLKHVENWNKYIEKSWASIWSFTMNHNRIHGQQNIKLCHSVCHPFFRVTKKKGHELFSLGYISFPTVTGTFCCSLVY